MVLIGVDAGGTGSTLVACNEFGDILARSENEALNYTRVGMYAARTRLRNAVDDLLDQTDADWCDFIAMGMSSVDGPANEDVLTQFCGDAFEPNRMRIDSAAHMALLGATGGSAGIISISGTDAMALAMDEAGKEYSAGGWGYLLNDGGSGFDIGNRVIRAAVEASEGGKDTVLAEMVPEWFGVDKMREIIPILYTESFRPYAIAEAARLADLGAQNGDAVCKKILSEAAESAALYVKALVNQVGVLPVYRSGGVFRHSPVFNAEYEKQVRNFCPEVRFKEPLLSPEEGALISAALSMGICTPDFCRTLLETR